MPYRYSSVNKPILKEILRSVTRSYKSNRRFNFEVTVPVADKTYRHQDRKAAREV